MTGMADQVLLNNEIGVYVKLSVGIANPFRNNTENWADHTIKPTIVHFNQYTGPGNSDWDLYPLGSLDSGTDVTRSGRNIDNRTGMNPKGPIVTTILESNSASNCNIFEYVRGTLGLVYRHSPWHGT